MVLISHISDEVARLTGRDTATMKQITRHLREAGLISQKGHGRGAAHGTPLDAARLLIAGMIPTSSLREAPEVVSLYGSLKVIGSPCEIEGVSLYRGRTFEDSLAETLRVIAVTGDDPHLLGDIEINLSARRATIAQTSGTLFDGPNPPANIPAAQVRNRIEFPDLLTLAAMVDED